MNILIFIEEDGQILSDGSYELIKEKGEYKLPKGISIIDIKRIIQKGAENRREIKYFKSQSYPHKDLTKPVISI